jgi:NagD protein
MKFGYLIDMDGVIYRENRLIPGAVEFVNALLSTGTPFLFLTNNSAPTAEDLTVRLRHLGVNGLSPKHFYTSAMNTADFLAETHPNCSVFVIGEGGLLTALHDYKIANDAIRPDYVVVGEGAATTEVMGEAEGAESKMRARAACWSSAAVGRPALGSVRGRSVWPSC